MSIMTIAPSEDASAERWRQWQLRNEASSRKSAMRARVVFTVTFAALAAWLGVQLLLSPLWS
jgi:hypothetical protein